VIIGILLAVLFFVDASFWGKHEILEILVYRYLYNYLFVAILTLPIIVPAYIVWGLLAISKSNKSRDLEQ
jgi:hypothetical protein